MYELSNCILIIGGGLDLLNDSAFENEFSDRYQDCSLTEDVLLTISSLNRQDSTYSNRLAQNHHISSHCSTPVCKHRCELVEYQRAASENLRVGINCNDKKSYPII